MKHHRRPQSIEDEGARGGETGRRGEVEEDDDAKSHHAGVDRWRR